MTKESSADQYGLADLKGLIPGMLAAGAGGGLLSGYMTSQTPERPGEDSSERRRRVIRNALTGALTAGTATGAGQLAWRNLSKAAPPMSPAAANVMDPNQKGSLLNNLGLGAAAGSWGYLSPYNHPKKGKLTGMKGSRGLRAWKAGPYGALGFMMADPLTKLLYHTVLPSMQN